MEQSLKGKQLSRNSGIPLCCCKGFFYNFFVILSGVRLSPLGTAATTGLLYQPQMINDGDCGAIGGVKIGRKTEVLGENLP
jgi:hypothetical protein